MDIGKILDFKPDTELRADNQFERSDTERFRKEHEPDRKRSKMSMPVYMESVNEGVHLTEDELEERRQELLAKAEIQSSQPKEVDESAARKLLALFDKRLKTNQQLRIKYAQKPDKFMNVSRQRFFLM
jgi:hypothetical protein